jgi:hypothetical protein
MQKIIKVAVLILAGYFLFFLVSWFMLIRQAKEPSAFYPSSTSTNLYYGDTDGSFQLDNLSPVKVMDAFMPEKNRVSMAFNYARECKTVKSIPGTLSMSAQQIAIYEKVASLGASSRDFDGDSQKIRSAIQTHQVLVQEEKNSGLKGQRLLNLVLGVVPEKFEPLVEELRQVGTLISFSVTKTDKTDQYRILMAKRAALEKKRLELVALKRLGGKMEDLLALQQKIFDTANEIQNLGVEIGRFEGQVSLCTVVVALAETGPGPTKMGLAFKAMTWSFWAYLKFWLLIIFGGLVYFALLKTIRKAKILIKTLMAFPGPGSGRKAESHTWAVFLSGCKIFLVFFAVLFLCRWVILFPQSKKSQIYVPETQAIGSPNYAKETPGVGSPGAAVYFEKVGTLTARSRDFDSNEKNLRSLIQEKDIYVQQEINEGLRGVRLLNLVLGVAPDKFDEVVGEMRKIGQEASFQVVRADKTNDYRMLLAKRESLSRNRAELGALKGYGGKMADLLALQEKIFEVEKALQDVGLQISRYETPDGFCAVLLTLKDIGPGPSALALAGRALGWTMAWCFGLLTTLFFILLGLMVLLWLAGKAKPFQNKS